MKKYSLLKALGIAFAVVILLSWIIPAGSYSTGTYSSLESTAPIGLFDIVRLIFLTIATFIQYGLVFLVIGGFYGVLNKTTAYSNIVNNIVKKWNKKKNKFLIITIIFFALLTSVSGLNNVMFILVPFFAAILLKLGYNKITTFASTIGSILVGQIGCTFGFNIWGYLKYFFELEMTSLIFARIILLVISVVLFVLLILKSDKKETSKEEKDIPLYEEVKGKKNSLPLIIISVLTLVLLLVGSYNWMYSFEVEIFSNLNESVMSFELLNYPIIANILGTTSEIGYFGNYDLVVILIFASIIIGWLYNVKVSEMLESFTDGIKKMLKPAFYGVISCIIFASILNMQEGNFINTIVNKLVSGSEDFTFLGTVFSSLITSFAMNDIYTLLGNFYLVFASYDANIIPIIAFIFQGMYGIVMLIAPTSILLLCGLSYFDISYKDWAKYIWKFLLALFGIIVVVAFILTTLI